MFLSILFGLLFIALAIFIVTQIRNSGAENHEGRGSTATRPIILYFYSFYIVLLFLPSLFEIYLGEHF